MHRVFTQDFGCGRVAIICIFLLPLRGGIFLIHIFAFHIGYDCQVSF